MNKTILLTILILIFSILTFLIYKNYNRILISVLTYLNKKISQLLSSVKLENKETSNLLSESDKMTIIKKTFDEDLRCLTITLKNNDELDVRAICKNVFNVLTNDEDYQEFGDKKAVMVIAITDNNQEYSLHHNVYFHNGSTEFDYYNQEIGRAHV